MHTATGGQHQHDIGQTAEQQDAIELQECAGGQLRNHDKDGALAEIQAVRGLAQSDGKGVEGEDRADGGLAEGADGEDNRCG